MSSQASPKTLFLVSGVWFSIALLWMWLSDAWFRMEHQAWSVMTPVLLLPVIGWLIPLIWAFIRLGAPRLPESGQLR